MESLTNRKKQVDRKPMTVWEKMYLPAIAKGMGITISHFFKRKPTIKYPEQKRTFSSVFRGVQILNRDEEGRGQPAAANVNSVETHPLKPDLSTDLSDFGAVFVEK